MNSSCTEARSVSPSTCGGSNRNGERGLDDAAPAVRKGKLAKGECRAGVTAPAGELKNNNFDKL